MDDFAFGSKEGWGASLRFRFTFFPPEGLVRLGVRASSPGPPSRENRIHLEWRKGRGGSAGRELRNVKRMETIEATMINNVTAGLY